MNLSGAWQFAKGWQLSAGVDNLFDTFYYEHLSKSVHASQAGLGYEQSGRIPSRAVPTGSRSTTVLPRKVCSNQLSQITFSVTDTAV